MKDKPLHPGRFLRDQILTPNGISAQVLAENFDVSINVVKDFLSGRRPMAASMAISLDVAFPDVKMTAIEWMEMQSLHALAFVNARCSFDHIVPYRCIELVDLDTVREW